MLGQRHGLGLPVGAVGARKEFGEVLIPGTHGTTYGGNPLACAVATSVMKQLLAPGFLDNVRARGQQLADGLKAMQRVSNKITEVKGAGLMVGLNTSFDIKALLTGLQDNGMMATQAGSGTLRLTPPLIVSESEIDEALNKIEKTLKELT